jgi:hypothetical protein
MSNSNKYLDYEGVKYLWSKINMQDYLNSETLINVISAIDETKANKDEIPVKISQLENDNNYLIEEVDPTVPDWAKAPVKPTYTASEVGADAAGAAIETLTTAQKYTDIAIADLVNSAPDTLNTLGELAIAFEENANMISTLDAAITNKAEKSDLNSLSDLVDVNAASIAMLQNELFNLIYPVGAIYLSTVETSPAILFGGTWRQIKDTFLLAAGNIYNNKETGGEATHTLTRAELPSEEGSITMHHAAIGTNINAVDGCFTGDSVVQGAYRQGGTLLNANTVSVGKIIYSNSGQNQAHNNMPPYLVVYMWQRIQ